MPSQVTAEPKLRTRLLAALHDAQEQDGYLSKEAIEGVAGQLGISVQETYSAATFYKLYKLKPVGKYVLQVCEGLSCYLAGGADLLVDYLRSELGIDPGETTPDGLFTLETVPCLASCGTSPAMRVNDQLYENLTEGSVHALLQKLRG